MLIFQVTKQNVNAAMVFEFLLKMCEVMGAYFGKIRYLVNKPFSYAPNSVFSSYGVLAIYM